LDVPAEALRAAIEAEVNRLPKKPAILHAR